MTDDRELHESHARTQRRFWLYIPASVLALGVLSLAMLVWTNRVNERQHMQYAFVNALEDLRIRVSTAHLWLEEAITYSTEEIDATWSDLRQAMRSADVLLKGGETEHGVILPPLQDPELRKKATDLRQHLIEFEANAHERWRTRAAVGSLLDKETNDIFENLQNSGADLEKILEDRQVHDYANSQRVFLGIVLAWSLIVAGSTIELVRREKKRRRAEEALRSAKDELEGRVVERTKELADLNQALKLELHERKRTEDALRESEAQFRSLSTRLLTAQETERRRISTELHDELGHALAYMKLQVGLLQQDREANPAAIKDACQKLSHFIDQVIENVRRLSRDLSPSILEDLGLSSALRWLLDTCVAKQETEIVSSIANLDHALIRKDQILVYRIVQEALTNVQKHAEATHVRLIIAAQADGISFVVEDDGKGFDVKQTAPHAVGRASDKGLGLTTMDERAQMLRGTLRVWSEEGKGTRITLVVPVQSGREQSWGRTESPSPTIMSYSTPR